MKAGVSRLVSEDRRNKCEATILDDGNFVLYRNGRPVWSSNTSGNGSGCKLIMQDDGNLVLYTAGGQPIWSSETHPYFGGVKFTTRDWKPVRLGIDPVEGLILLSATGRTAWKSGMYSYIRDNSASRLSGKFTLTVGQSIQAGESYLVSGDNQVSCEARIGNDGELILYRRGIAVWSSNTGGKGSGCRLKLQYDGNLVLYDRSNKAIWSSQTYSKRDGYKFSTREWRPTTCVIDPSHGLTLYSASGRQVWDSESGIAPESRYSSTTFSKGYPKTVLDAGQSIEAGKSYLASSNANLQYEARILEDGDFVLFRGGAKMWSSNTNGRGEMCKLVMQTDGNLVLTDRYNNPLWSSETHPYFGGAKYNTPEWKPVKCLIDPVKGLVLISTTGKEVWSSSRN
jgi:hypothetical protein